MDAVQLLRTLYMLTVTGVRQIHTREIYLSTALTSTGGEIEAVGPHNVFEIVDEPPESR